MVCAAMLLLSQLLKCGPGGPPPWLSSEQTRNPSEAEGEYHNPKGEGKNSLIEVGIIPVPTV